MARRTARQRAASKRNLVKARAKRSRGRKVAIAGGVAAAAVLGTAVSYRAYDKRVERNQVRYNFKKAWDAQHKNNPNHPEYQMPYHATYMGRQHPNPKQPRRYRKRPLTQQTKRAIYRHRKKVLGNRVGGAINIADRVTTARSPYSPRVSMRKKEAYARTNVKRVRVQRFDGDVMVRVRVGKRMASAGFVRREAN